MIAASALEGDACEEQTCAGQRHNGGFRPDIQVLGTGRLPALHGLGKGAKRAAMRMPPAHTQLGYTQFQRKPLPCAKPKDRHGHISCNWFTSAVLPSACCRAKDQRVEMMARAADTGSRPFGLDCKI